MASANSQQVFQSTANRFAANIANCVSEMGFDCDTTAFENGKTDALKIFFTPDGETKPELKETVKIGKECIFGRRTFGKKEPPKTAKSGQWFDFVAYMGDKYCHRVPKGAKIAKSRAAKKAGK